jgi:hypothetical protein
MLLGFLLALGDAIRRRGRSDDAPLVAVWLVGLGVFVSFTWSAPSADAAKGSDLLPLAVPGAVFFARAVRWLPAGLRAVVLAVSAAAAVAAAVVFTTGLVFPPLPPGRMANLWRFVGLVMPDSYIGEAVNHLAGRP